MTDIKRCAHCQEDKPSNFFGISLKRPDGRNPYCKPCRRTLNEGWMLKRRAALIATGIVVGEEPKACTKCKVVKSAADYHFDKKRVDGLATYCKECRAVQQRAWHQQRAASSDAYVQARVRSSKETSKATRQLYKAKVRQEIIDFYSNGTRICACCGEHRGEFLTVDHINGGGRQHRKVVKNFYSWLKNSGFPPGFRILCMNCNMARGIHGYCPHEREKGDTGGALNLASGTLRVGVWRY